MKRGNRITGHSNPALKQFEQIATADTTINFYGFEAVGADAVVSTLEYLTGGDALADCFKTTVKTAYQGVYYSGAFGRIKLSSGEAVLRLSEQ